MRCCKLSALLAFSLLLSACRTIDRSAAQALATDGAAFSRATASAVRDTRSSLETYVEGLYLVAPLRGTAPPTTQALQSIDRVVNALAARAAMLNELTSTYNSFAALANYDAAAQVEGAVNELTGAVNDYAKAVGSGNRISGVTGRLTSIGASLIAEQVQSRKLREGSVIIRERLAAARELMEREREPLAAIREEVVRGNGTSARILWRHGVGAPNVIFTQQLGSFGLDYEPKQALAAIEKDRAKFAPAVEGVVLRRIQRRAQLQEATLAATIDAFDELISAHTELEKGQEPNLQAISQRIIQIRGYVDELTKLAGEDKKDQ